VDASILEVSFHYGNHREFLVLTHNVPRIIISEKQQQKHKVPVKCLYLQAGPTITDVTKCHHVSDKTGMKLEWWW